jgi:hypothetical protein
VPFDRSGQRRGAIRRSAGPPMLPISFAGAHTIRQIDRAVPASPRRCMVIRNSASRRRFLALRDARVIGGAALFRWSLVRTAPATSWRSMTTDAESSASGAVGPRGIALARVTRGGCARFSGRDGRRAGPGGSGSQSCAARRSHFGRQRTAAMDRVAGLLYRVEVVMRPGKPSTRADRGERLVRLTSPAHGSPHLDREAPPGSSQTNAERSSARHGRSSSLSRRQASQSRTGNGPAATPSRTSPRPTYGQEKDVRCSSMDGLPG